MIHMLTDVSNSFQGLWNILNIGSGIVVAGSFVVNIPSIFTILALSVLIFSLAIGLLDAIYHN